MHITLRHLAAFVATAEYQSLTAAALHLNISQPSISSSIALLEGHYGRRLFTRHPGQGVRLTTFGTQIAKRSRKLLSDALDLESFGHRDTSLGGTLVVGCFKDLAPYYMPTLLRTFIALEPAVTVRLKECDFDEIGTMLNDGAIDIALTYDLLIPSTMEKTVLAKQQAHCLFAQGHSLEQHKVVSLKDVARYPLILVNQAGSWQYVLQLFHSQSLDPAIAFRPSTFEMQRALVARDFGVAISYTRPATDRSYDGTPVCVRPIADALPQQAVLLAHPPASLMTSQAAAFIKSCITAADSLPVNEDSGAEP